jgi:hypothetical protein
VDTEASVASQASLLASAVTTSELTAAVNQVRLGFTPVVLLCFMSTASFSLGGQALISSGIFGGGGNGNGNGDVASPDLSR